MRDEAKSTGNRPMRRVNRSSASLALALIALSLACQPQPTPPLSSPPPDQEPMNTPPPAAEVIVRKAPELMNPSEVVVYLDNQEVMTFRGALLGQEPQAITYRFYAQATSTRPAADANRRYLLRSDKPDHPVIQCEIQENDQGSETAIILWSENALPDIHLLANTAKRLLPIRLSNDNPDIMHAALGPVSGDWFDALFDPRSDWAMAMSGRVHCQTASDSIVLTVSPDSSDGNRQTVLTLHAYSDFLQRHYGLRQYQPQPLDTPPPPASWAPLPADLTVKANEYTRNNQWMAVNLRPYGAGSLSDHSPLDLNATYESAPGPPYPLGDQDWGVLNNDSRTASGDPALHLLSGINSWGDVLQSARTIASRFWRQGILTTQITHPLRIGEPLQFEQARTFASLVGLSGQTPLLAERMYSLTRERVNLLQKIIPTPPVRTLALFTPHQWPTIWNLAVFTQSRRWNVVGLFNLSAETEKIRLDLADLHLPIGKRQYAVYDVWNQRLIRVIEDHLTLRLAPNTCRVVCIKTLHPDRPTLIASNRHITCGWVDLRNVRWHPDRLEMTGQSNVVANDPYCLTLIVPPETGSYEIVDVQTDHGLHHVYGSDRLRVICLESDSTRTIDWIIRFASAHQPKADPPAPPAAVEVIQNTRGVQLSWKQYDDQAAFFRIYRNRELLAEVEETRFQDSSIVYRELYSYAVTAVDAFGQESPQTEPVIHETPVPASTNLTELLPLSVHQDEMQLRQDENVLGLPMRIAGNRLYRGLGTHAESRVTYFLGGGYDLFTGVVGIDDVADRRGSALFEIRADDEVLFKSTKITGGQRPRPFSVRITGKQRLELIVTDAGDGNEFDYADWGNPYLRILPPQPKRNP